MKKQAVFAFSLVVSVVFFNSCEKEAIEAPVNKDLTTANVATESSNQNPIATIVAAQISRTDSISISSDLSGEVQSRSGKQLIYQGDITLNQGQWALAALYKSQLAADYIYSATVTPSNGDPDLYIHGRQPGSSGAFRQIRSSRNPGTQMEEETASVNDLTSSEDRLYFSIYATTNTRFTLQIFKEAIPVPVQVPSVGFLTSESWTDVPYYGTKGYGNYFADVTGDLRADAIVVNADGITVRRSTGAGFAPNEKWTEVGYYGTRGTFFADVTGDGKADAIVVNDNFVTVRRSTGAGFAPNEKWTDVAYYGTRGTFFADVTGDGKADAIVVNDNFITVRRSTGNGFAPNERWTDVPYYGGLGYNSAYFADVTGDGKADAIVVNATGITVRRSTGNTFAPNERWTSEAFYATIGLTQFADVTGDGKADAIAVSSSNIMVRRSNGAGFLASENWTNDPYYGARGTFFADVTGDIKADAVIVGNDKVTVRRSK